MKYLKDQNSINMKIKLFTTSIFFSFSTLLLAELNIVRAFPNLQFDQLVDLQSPNDNSNRIFILEQEGEIYVFENLDSVSDTTQFLDIRDKVEFQGEMGLLGLAFHPDYENNGYFFINYIAPDPRRTVIARYEISATDSNTANSDSEMIILEINQPYNNHNGGQVAFGPDGYLYIGMGDGGNGGDPLNHGQNLGTLHGAMLRIDINNVGEENNYVIPSDNPYVNNNEGHREEIYAYGFRNPWRFSFDNFTGNCWIADVGQDEYEEISILELGGNFGWNIMEGFHCFNPSANCDTSGLILPIYEYDHSIGESITGGYVYRGTMLPSLIGKYIFADFEYGDIYALEYNDLNNLDVYSIGDLGPYSVTSFGVDHNNEIYICKLNGEIYKFLDDSVISIDSIDDIEFSMPTHYVLHQNYPNPFNPFTTLGYDLQQDGLVNITIYDMLGNAVNTLVNTNQSSGYKSIQWDATNNQAEPVSAGMYIYVIQAGTFRQTKKMVLLK